MNTAIWNTIYVQGGSYRYMTDLHSHTHIHIYDQIYHYSHCVVYVCMCKLLWYVIIMMTLTIITIIATSLVCNNHWCQYCYHHITTYDILTHRLDDDVLHLLYWYNIWNSCHVFCCSNHSVSFRYYICMCDSWVYVPFYCYCTLKNIVSKKNNPVQ